MRSRIIAVVSKVVALAVVVALPWFAWREAQRQAFEAAAEMMRAHARAVLHRAEKTGAQANAALVQLARVRSDPCSPQARALMRDIDLTSTYIQAVAYVRDGAVVCSSMGELPLALGAASLRRANGLAIHPRVSVPVPGGAPLIAVERGGFAVLMHRDLPLDISVDLPDLALAVLHLDADKAGTPELSRGVVDRAWATRLNGAQQASFVDGRRLVAVVRSPHFRLAAVAAVPVSHLEERTRTIAWRLVPAAAVAALAITAALLALARRRRSLGAALRVALRRNEFYLLYQPIVELASRRCVGVEALLRWRRPDGEQIGPDLFIPVAEQTGFITRLTERVLELIEAEAGDYLAANPGFHVALNLSTADLGSAAIVERIERMLERTGAAPSNLVVELTERGFLDLDNAPRVLAAFRARGIEVAIDDFGTGYSSLSYLESLELDVLKIDRVFVDAIATRAPASQMVDHIIAMARTMELQMVAEGVESEAQADYLREQGVQYAQGWLFGKPMPWADAIRLAAADDRDAVLVA